MVYQASVNREDTGKTQTTLDIGHDSIMVVCVSPLSVFDLKNISHNWGFTLVGRLSLNALNNYFIIPVGRFSS